jgi:transposase
MSPLSFASQPEMGDDIIKENGRDALHLPPYHSDLNPMELVWEDIKNRVAQECMSTNLKEM